MEKVKKEYCVVEDGIYDIKSFQVRHPGGPQVLALFGGKDATAHYYSYHPHLSKKSTLEQYRVDSIPLDQSYEHNSPFYVELKKKVYGELKKPFADWSFWIKCILLLVSTVALEWYTLLYGRQIWSSLLLGWFFALIGLNIQHDANHAALSKHYWVNRLLGYSQDWIGGSSLLWRHQHVLLHHAETNRHGRDPDHKGSKVVRFSWRSEYHIWFRLQYLYTLPLTALLSFQWVFADIGSLVYMFHKEQPISPLSTSERNLALIFRALFIIRFYVLPLYFYPSWQTIYCILLSMFMAAGYLGFFFILSHNFVGVEQLPADIKKKDWAKVQIETSSNVGGKWLCILNGGLNYQIEHHLFPRICHVHYPRIAPIVEQHCKEYGVIYKHFPSVTSNLTSMLSLLYSLGTITKKID